MQKTLQELYDDNPIYSGDPLADDMGGKAGRVHDWRSYIGVIADIWPSLSRETRMAVALVADAMASREEWD